MIDSLLRYFGQRRIKTGDPRKHIQAFANEMEQEVPVVVDEEEEAGRNEYMDEWGARSYLLGLLDRERKVLIDELYANVMDRQVVLVSATRIGLAAASIARNFGDLLEEI
jgi:hypothetical protein